MLALALVPVSGCRSSSKPKGPITPKLLGKWECRKGFAGKVSMDFHDNNTITVGDTKGDKTTSYTAQWYLHEDGKDSLKIQILLPKKKDYELRLVKFLDAESFELKSGATIMGRFQKIAK